MPGTLVRAVLNGPPVSAPGLGSNVSRWLGPPLSQTITHCFAFRAGASAASTFCTTGENAQPSTPATPACKTWRRPTTSDERAAMMSLLSSLRPLRTSFQNLIQGRRDARPTMSVIRAELGTVEQQPPHVLQPLATLAR